MGRKQVIAMNKLPPMIKKAFLDIEKKARLAMNKIQRLGNSKFCFLRVIAYVEYGNGNDN